MFDLFVEHETSRIQSSQQRQQEDQLSGKGGGGQKQKSGSGEKEKQIETGPQGPPPRLVSGQQSGYGGAKRGQQDTRPPPKQRDQQGQYNYTDDDETMWEYLGNIDRATEPNKIDINFFESFSELEEKIEREKRENEKLVKK
ncbi:MAG: hypothetical protein EZS28_028087 [Streblomastix strix]|uniref:Uncharacterized protein n=1 Tax=Streblomastix strix TaxID=222440 RepID=A0A5J4V198_9EUKA|nr:MAG: hypothetical protein EZS28_028087 [Streblomastix strix]